MSALDAFGSDRTEEFVAALGVKCGPGKNSYGQRTWSGTDKRVFIMVSHDGLAWSVHVSAGRGGYGLPASGRGATLEIAEADCAQSVLRLADEIAPLARRLRRKQGALSNLARTALSGAAGHGVLAEGMRKAVGK